MECSSLNIENRTTEQYIRGIVDITLSDDLVANILSDREINPESYVSELDHKTKMLLKADVYMACANMPSVKVSIEDADGNWKHKEGGGQISETDKRRWSSIANNIYAQYGENCYVSKGPKLHARGMRIWRNGYGC